ncbi:MAG: acyl-CoA dehydrogenase [Rhodothermales bacterium]|nr:acyl-CoA dehydrogenase [Rhodothermales bacterium]
MQPWQDPELEKIRQAHIEFAKENLEGDYGQRDKDGDFSFERWKTAAEYGTLALGMPEQFGGKTVPISHIVAAYEGLGYGCHDTGFLYAMLSQLCGTQMTLKLLASEKLQEKYLPAMIAGDSLAAYCSTEEEVGSDVFAMSTMAIPVDDGFKLNGHKRYLTNSPKSNLALVFAKTDESRNPFGLVALMVDMDSEGARHGEEFEKAGFRTVPMGELFFDDVHVPKENVIGGAGGGLRAMAESAGWERTVLLANALGPMKRTIDEVVARARTRKQYGKPIGSHQQISAKIADMITRYTISRQLVYDIATRVDNGGNLQPHLQDASIAKLYVTESYIQNQLAAVQIFGVRGILMDYPYQQDLRDSIGSTIWAGTSESLRNTIAKMSGLPVE